MSSLEAEEGLPLQHHCLFYFRMSAFVGISFLSSVALSAMASSALNSPRTSVLKEPLPKVLPKADEKKFALSLGFSNSQNFYESNQPDKKNTYVLEILPVYKLSESSSLSALSYAVFDAQAKEHVATLKSTLLAWKVTTYKMAENATFAPSLLAVVPTNGQQVANDKYRGGLGVKGTMTFTQIGKTGFDFSLASSIRRNFNDVEVGADGEPLIQHGLPQEMTLTYKFNPELRADFFSRYIFSYTYSGKLVQRFLLSLSTSYQINSNWSVSGGIANEGSAFKADGVGSNVRLYDDETSELFLSIGISI